jgi:hypothetical protein
VPYDTTRFVEVSIKEVLITLGEAMLLVFLVVYLFLQSWRAAVIPFLAVPVSLIGAFAGLQVLGYSINTLTLFGMVLAIGIVVDDAIVVLENVERIMREDQLPPRDAAIKAMREVTGPIIAIVLTLTAVFVPIAFLGGLTGELYRQFAVTIAISVVISGLMALTLSPALCVLMLSHSHKPPGRFFQAFNRFFARVTHGYTDGVIFMIRRGLLGALLFVGMVAITAGLWRIDAGQPRARRGPGLLHRGGDPARRRVARPHRQGRQAGRGADARESGEQGHRLVRGPRLHRRRVPQQRRDDLRDADPRGTSGPWARSSSSASCSAARWASRRRWCSRSARRRSSGWAPRAASSSTSRTAATAAPSACRR